MTYPVLDDSATLLMTARVNFWRRIRAGIGRGVLFSIAALAAFAILFIFYFIVRDAWPFFQTHGFREFFTETAWYPSRQPPRFGAAAIFFGSAMVTAGAVLIAAPFGIAAAVCLSDVLPFGLRQVLKPVIEMLAAVPSVAYGFFALVIFAPFLQEHGGMFLKTAWWLAAAPAVVLCAVILGDFMAAGTAGERKKRFAPWLTAGGLAAAGLMMVGYVGQRLGAVEIISGTNALNVSLILGVMALPTVVSIADDALQAAGRELREASYALGATRAETICRVIIPAAGGGIFAAVLLGVMRALGETMVVWMASGNAAHIPHPWFNYLAPIRTLTATIAGDMGEADHVTGSARYHVLFALGTCLLAFCLLTNVAAEWLAKRQRRKLKGS